MKCPICNKSLSIEDKSSINSNIRFDKILGAVHSTCLGSNIIAKAKNVPKYKHSDSSDLSDEEKRIIIDSNIIDEIND